MTTTILLIAHAPLAQALRACALHVYPDCEAEVMALDVLPDEDPEITLIKAEQLRTKLGEGQMLVLTDIFGATPSNVAKKLVEGTQTKLIAGVNLPMLLRAICYRHEPIETLLQRALAGGAQGVMQVAVAAPQNQIKRNYDQKQSNYQQ
jgi:PTS system ascorbate-specific IIA component